MYSRKLNRTKKHRQLMFMNMMNSIILYEYIKTTLYKAKEVSSLLEKLIQKAKVNSIANKKKIFSVLRQKITVHKLLYVIIPRLNNRIGGYTRIIKCGYRKGDCVLMAYVEILGRVNK